MPPELTQAYVRSVLDYAPETGDFVWKPRYPDIKGWNKKRAGKLAGTLMASGYRAINLIGVPRYCHRLAFIWMDGTSPEMVDHADGKRDNNRWSNLRPADNSKNLANAKLRNNNISGVKGVCWYAANDCWHAQIHKDGERIHLGYFRKKEEAAAAYQTAALKLFGEFARFS